MLHLDLGRLPKWSTLAAAVSAVALGTAVNGGTTAWAAAPANDAVYQKSVTNKLNATGRRISMPVPFREDQRSLGEIIIFIEPNDLVLVPKAALIDKLTASLDAGALARLHALRDSNGQLSLADLAAAGFKVRFDPNALELHLDSSVDQRRSGDISIARGHAPIVSANMTNPAIFSGYLNVLTGIDHRWGSSTGDARTSGRVDFESVLSLYGVVLENDFAYDGLVDQFRCPAGAICTVQHQEGWKRRRSRLVYDMPSSQLRLQVGDADTQGTGFQRSPDVLGVTIEKSPRKLRPGESIRPTGRSSFRIERPSDIDVMINGAIVQRLRLRAGNYNLSDLPLSAGANEIQLVINDDAGERRTLSFTTFFDGNLLAQGKSEWSLSGGVPSYFKDNDRAYRHGEHFGTGFLRYGVTDQVTGELHVQADSYVVMSGFGVFGATPWGFLGAQAAASRSDTRNLSLTTPLPSTGFAANVTWDLVNVKGPFYQYYGRHESFRLSAEYRSSGFRAPGEFLATATGILYPQYNYRYRLNAAYSAPLDALTTATLSARYQWADDKQLVLSPNTLRGDRFGVDLTLSRALRPDLSGSVTLGYSNESYLFHDTSVDRGGDFRVVGRLFWRPDEQTRVSVSHDTLMRDTYASAYRTVGRGIDRWETSIDTLHNGQSDSAHATAGVAHFGNRGEVRLSHSGGFQDGSSSHGSSSDQRTSLRVGTSLAFADGQVAVGAPIRGNGFAVVVPHQSIANKTVSVGSADEVRARADAFGPAVIGDIPAYTNGSVPVDVADLPLGYSLGTGTFDTFAPYKAGFRLEVGSAHSVSAFGTLVTTAGEPIALLSGIAYPADNAKRQVAVFTNNAGRFGADGLAPGKWIIEMATEGAPTRFMIDVPAGTDGLLKVGTLKPVKS